MSAEPWVYESLSSKAPSERARAIGWTVQNPTEISTSALVKALQAETVPRLRDQLNRVLESRQRQAVRDRPDRNVPLGRGAEAAVPSWQGDVAGLIRHELSPAVGWIRLAGDQEIAGFAGSATNSAVRKLQRRMDGLVALIKRDEPLNIRQLDLIELLRESWPDPVSFPILDPRVDLGSPTIDIETDEALFCTLLSNGYQNALDAASEAQPNAKIVTSWGYTPDRFWVRISNPFRGTQFKLDDVLRSGVTSKVGHQGQGLGVMISVAGLLGMTFSVEGVSGTATLSLSGPRNRA